MSVRDRLLEGWWEAGWSDKQEQAEEFQDGCLVGAVL